MSGTYNYVPVIDDLLTEAWERCGKSPAILNGEVARSARRSLQLMLIDWTNRGLNLWQVNLATLSATVDVVDYVLDPSTVDVLSANVVVNGQELVLTSVSRSDYNAIPNKISNATRPTQFWIERILPAPVMHIYPSPDQAYTINYYRIRQPQDVTGLGVAVDTPLLWSEAVTAGLAARLAVKFAPDRVGLLGPLAAEAYTIAAGENRERVPLRAVPDLGYGF